MVIVTLFSIHSLSFAKVAHIAVNDDKDASPTELRKRIRRLQEAVLDLQNRVDDLEARLNSPSSNTVPGTGTAPTAAPTPASITCFIETPFDGIFDATEANETKARVEAVKACMAKVKSRIHCAAEKVKCGL